jgi:hypothetical protein
LTVWTNQESEVFFSSRREPLMNEFANLLKKGNFAEKISVRYHEETNLKITLPIEWEIKA